MKFPVFSALGALLLPLLPLRAAEPATDTVVECAGIFETVSTDTEITSTFRDKVVVTGNNLKITCDFLTIVAIRESDTTAALGKYRYFKSLVATGHVRIIQGDREATCARGEIFPGEEKIILSGKTDGALPRVRSIDDQYTAEGPRIVLYRGQRRAVIEGEGESGPGTRITLPALKDLGYDKDKAKPSPTPPPAENGPKITLPVK